MYVCMYTLHNMCNAGDKTHRFLSTKFVIKMALTLDHIIDTWKGFLKTFTINPLFGSFMAELKNRS